METEEEIKQLEEDLKHLDVKELSTKSKLLLFLLLIGYILFSLWWDLLR